ncbi:hypothetical protein [Kingella oralis]|jgi:hypothetical protein|uniref:hypothetical protein n=1 Tax=Kingella oralis TaxID=505 RepID=UPI002063F667|nr:MAG TPA: cell division protein [Caudoviricetes sp.]
MRILYFTTDFSLENVAFAKQHGMIIRAANAIESAANVEVCDFVYGDVPAAYRVFPEYTLPENDLTAERDAQIAECKAENAALKDEVAKRDNTISALEAELQTAKAQIETLQAQLDALQTTKKQPEKPTKGE